MRFPRPFEKVVLTLCEDVDTPRSLAVSLLVKNCEWEQLFSLKTAPSHYLDSESYFRDVAVTDFCRKMDEPGLIPDRDLGAECWDRFRATEKLCTSTNLRMTQLSDGLLEADDLALVEFLHRVRKIIREIMGPIPASLPRCGFGPGATLTNTSRRCTVPDKLTDELCGTSGAIALWKGLYGASPWWRSQDANLGHEPKVVRGCRFFTVPKTALSERGACLSPNINGFLQKGIGVHLRQRLRETVGIRIDGDQSLLNRRLTTAEQHRHLAEWASRSEALATIDLSDASNTIARELVRQLVPPAWYELLDTTRERYVLGPDSKWWKLEMFSAMGNGFTFELETIVFYAIARACSGDDFVSVFGDDIMVSTHNAERVIAALRWAGFVPNEAKTFVGGPFRESCGGDFFDGVPVRAHFQKVIPREPQEWISLANGIRRMAYGDPRTDLRWAYLSRAWFCVLDNLPIHIRRNRGPHELGDLIIHDDEARWTWVRKDHSPWQRLFRCYAPAQKRLPWKFFKPDVVYLSALYGVPSEGAIPRAAVDGYRMTWIPFS